MSSTPAQVRARLLRSVRAAETMAMRADQPAVERAAQHLTEADLLDEASAEFLREAPRTVLGLSVALNAVLDAHRPLRHHDSVSLGCRECGTGPGELCRTVTRLAEVFALYHLRRSPCVDEAEAWRRAHARRPAVNGQGEQVVSVVSEIADAFVVRSLVIDPPPPPPRVKPDSERVLLVDKTSGQVVVWPFMSQRALQAGYAQYRQGRSVIPVEPGEQEADVEPAEQPTEIGTWPMRLTRLAWWRARSDTCAPTSRWPRRR